MFFQGTNVDHKQLSGSKPNLWFESRKTEIPQPVQLAQASRGDELAMGFWIDAIGNQHDCIESLGQSGS